VFTIEGAYLRGLFLRGGKGKGRIEKGGEG